jgi:hypothetical protein
MSSDVEVQPPPPAASLRRFEIPVAGLGAATLFIAAFVIPFVGPLGLPLAPIPVVRLSHRRGAAAGALAGLVACAAVLGIGWASGGAGSGLLMAFVAAALLGLPTASVGFLRAGADPSRCYLGLCIAGIALVAGLAAVAASTPGRSLAGEAGAVFSRVAPTVEDQYRRTGADAQTAATARATVEAAAELVRRYFWGLLAASWMGVAAVAFYGGAAAARPTPTADASRFDALRVPAAAAGLFAASGAAFGLLPGEGRRIAGNLLIPLAALYFVAGLSIICHFFRRWFRLGLLRAGLYVLIAYAPPLNVGAALLGLFDWYVDFRRRGGGRTERT